ncbi:bifunctional riboflavin kinase/FAD synthetase, partial [Streptomyces goshikiensis]
MAVLDVQSVQGLHGFGRGAVTVQRWRGLEDIPQDWGRSVVTIGSYDGVHRGHQ